MAKPADYTEGTSERFVGEYVASERERFVVATKYTLCTNPNDPNAGGNHRKNLVQALDASLKRLVCAAENIPAIPWSSRPILALRA